MSLPETVLLGYVGAIRPHILTKLCACGGFITADTDDPIAIQDAVVFHQASRRHRGWRRRNKL